jgi:N-acetylated-alpha-linked acidic dipeptidase
MTIVDVAVCGSRYKTLGSPSLAHFIRDTAGAVPHPTLTNKTLWDARLDEGPFKEEGNHLYDYRNSAVVMEGVREEARVKSEELPIAPLGSGSDYTGILLIFKSLPRH